MVVVANSIMPEGWVFFLFFISKDLYFIMLFVEHSTAKLELEKVDGMLRKVSRPTNFKEDLF